MNNTGVDKCLKRYSICGIKYVILKATLLNNEKLRRDFLNSIPIILTNEENENETQNKNIEAASKATGVIESRIRCGCKNKTGIKLGDGKLYNFNYASSDIITPWEGEKKRENKFKVLKNIIEKKCSVKCEWNRLKLSIKTEETAITLKKLIYVRE